MSEVKNVLLAHQWVTALAIVDSYEQALKTHLESDWQKVKTQLEEYLSEGRAHLAALESALPAEVVSRLKTGLAPSAAVKYYSDATAKTH